MATEPANNAQQSQIGMLSTRVCGLGSSVGVTVAAGFSVAGRSISGRVCFISTEDFLGRFAKTVIRAVFFFGDDVIGEAGRAAVAALVGEVDCPVADGEFVCGRAVRARCC